MRVLIADDSALFRRVISTCLASLPEVEIVGAVSTGSAAVQKTKELSPDLLTLDIEMPGLNGIQVLEALHREGAVVDVILVSALTKRGGALTLEGLSKGAFDFVTKPEAGSFEENLKRLQGELVPRLRAIAQRNAVRQILRSNGATSKRAEYTAQNQTTARMSPSLAKRTELVLVGVSTGGPKALEVLLPQIPADLGVPILIVQHMPPLFTGMLAANLQSKCRLDVREARDGEPVRPNVVYIAPGGKQMRMTTSASRTKMIEITDDPPENNCKPAVDYLFRSAANQFPGVSIAVILTGMGNDGTLGLRLLKRQGCRVIAQDEASCVVFGMPKSAIEAGVVDSVLPLTEIASHIVANVRGVKA